VSDSQVGKYPFPTNSTIRAPASVGDLFPLVVHSGER